jgi:hypothetical protein
MTNVTLGFASLPFLNLVNLPNSEPVGTLTVSDPSSCPSLCHRPSVAFLHPRLTDLSFPQDSAPASRTLYCVRFLPVANSVCLKLRKAGGQCLCREQPTVRARRAQRCARHSLDSFNTQSHNHIAFGRSFRIEGQQILRKDKTRPTVSEYSRWPTLPADIQISVLCLIQSKGKTRILILPF